MQRKQELSNMTIAQGESWLTDMSDNELSDLFALGENAVMD